MIQLREKISSSFSLIPGRQLNFLSSSPFPSRTERLLGMIRRIIKLHLVNGGIIEFPFIQRWKINDFIVGYSINHVFRILSLYRLYRLYRQKGIIKRQNALSRMEVSSHFLLFVFPHSTVTRNAYQTAKHHSNQWLQFFQQF